jgi:hypothetical protein
MSALGDAVRATDGVARYARGPELWSTAGLLADTLPLDRPPRYARPARQTGHWVRLALWDRALVNRDRTAVLIVGQPPWRAAAAATLVAALVGPRLPKWLRRVAIGAAVASALARRHQVRDELELQRRMEEIAPGGLLIEHLATHTPNAAVNWVREMFDTLDRNEHRASFVALLPGARRDRVRERIYTRRWGFTVASRAVVDGRELSVLVRETGLEAPGR